jgi:hypothetical protein
MRRAFWLLLVAAVVAGERAGDAAAVRYVTLTVTPLRALAPADVHFTVHLADDGRNRELVALIVGDNFSQRSDMPLDGDERVLQVAPFRHVPSGHYTAMAIVRRNDGTESADRTDVCLIGPTEECQ